MVMVANLEDINQGILHYVKEFCGKTNRFAAASKLGISIPVVDHICSLNPAEVENIAEEYARQGLIITFSNFMVERQLDSRTLSLDSFFKSSVI